MRTTACISACGKRLYTPAAAIALKPRRSFHHDAAFKLTTSSRACHAALRRNLESAGFVGPPFYPLIPAASFSVA